MFEAPSSHLNHIRVAISPGVSIVGSDISAALQPSGPRFDGSSRSVQAAVVIRSSWRQALLPLLVTLVAAGCASGTTTSTRPTSSIIRSPLASSAPSQSAIPPRAPLSYPPLTDSGSWATVTVDHLQVLDRLAVVEYPENHETLAHLGRGTEVLVADGPLANQGLDWYQVYFSWLPTDPPFFTDISYGWVAGGSSGETPTSISIEPPRCPDAVSANVIGGMSRFARLHCLGTGPHEVTGVIHGCTDYYVYGEPAWLFTECLNLFNLDGTPSNLFLYFPPVIDTTMFDAGGDVVRVVGHVDDPLASECQPANPYPPIKSFEQASLVEQCRVAFVVSEIEVTGHVDLAQ
jgi:hypothetical protein